MTNPKELDVREGDGFQYVAREIVVDLADLPIVMDDLARFRAEPRPVEGPLREYIAIYVLPTDEPDVPTVVQALRKRARNEELRVGPNTVHRSSSTVWTPAPDPVYHAGPGGAPEPATPLPYRAEPGGVQVGVRVAVLDTGVAQQALGRKPLAGRYDPQTAEADPVYISGQKGQIALTAGHGTMVGAIIAMHAPQAQLLFYKVLQDSVGGVSVGTDLTVGNGILDAVAAGATILNLSLGGYTMPGPPPVAIDAPLRNIADDIAVVAAAGNDTRSDKYYPAAHPRVYAVAALDTRAWQGDVTAPPPSAPFSNRGTWVAACSAGVWIYSAYVTGRWSHLGHSKQFDHGFAYWSGTSFAAPHVAAMIADGVRPGQPPRKVADNLVGNGTRVPDFGAFLVPPNVLTGPATWVV